MCNNFERHFNNVYYNSRWQLLWIPSQLILDIYYIGRQICIPRYWIKHCLYKQKIFKSHVLNQEQTADCLLPPSHSYKHITKKWSSKEHSFFNEEIRSTFSPCTPSARIKQYIYPTHKIIYDNATVTICDSGKNSILLYNALYN